MKMFIRIQDGAPFEHPLVLENMRQLFPDHDLETAPEGFALFERVNRPNVGAYEVYEGVTYALENGLYKDVHSVRDMTDAEKTAKQEEVKANWAIHGLASWVFNEARCEFEAPTAYPDDGKRYRWDEATTAWIEVTSNV